MLYLTSVIGRLESMTRVDSSHDFWWLWFHSSHIEKDGYSTRHEPIFSQNDSSQSHFCKISEPLINKPSLFACKEMIIFWPSNDQNWWKFSVLTFMSCYPILYPKGQVFITCTKMDLRFAFHWRARRAQYRPIATSPWSNQVFAYRDNGSRPDTVTLNFFPDTVI